MANDTSLMTADVFIPSPPSFSLPLPPSKSALELVKSPSYIPWETEDKRVKNFFHYFRKRSGKTTEVHTVTRGFDGSSSLSRLSSFDLNMDYVMF